MPLTVDSPWHEDLHRQRQPDCPLWPLWWHWCSCCGLAPLAGVGGASQALPHSCVAADLLAHTSYHLYWTKLQIINLFLEHFCETIINVLVWWFFVISTLPSDWLHLWYWPHGHPRRAATWLRRQETGGAWNWIGLFLLYDLMLN